MNGNTIANGSMSVYTKLTAHSIETTSDISSDGCISSTSQISAPKYILSESDVDTEVLVPTIFDGQQPIKVTYSDGSTGSLAGQIHSKVCNFNNVMHMISCQTALSSLTNPIKEMTFSTGQNANGRQTDTISTTAAND